MPLAPTVPNRFPTLPSRHRIALVGDCATTHDRSWVRCISCHHAFASLQRDGHTHQEWEKCMRCGSPVEAAPQPFAGPLGALLALLLGRLGLRREECFLGLVSQHQPPRNEINRFKWDGPEVQGGLEALRRDLRAFQPELVLCFGQAALRAFRGHGKLDELRGFLFESDFLAGGGESKEAMAGDGAKADALTGTALKVFNPFAQPVPCLATFHPSAILKSPSGSECALAETDMRKALRALAEGFPAPPPRHLRIYTNPYAHTECLLQLSMIKEQRTRVAIDIEGSCHGISCIGFAISATEAFVVPFADVNGQSIWSYNQELELWQAVASVLEDENVPKIIQNALYEWFALAWSMGIVIQGVADDIMLKHFELYAEFDKALEFQASLYTRQPFWKLSHRRDKRTGLYRPYRNGKPVSTEEWLVYNATDCCVTYECWEAQEPLLKPMQRAHYRENMEALAPILYMMLRGMRYDYEQAKTHRKKVERKIFALQDRINRECAEARPALAGFFGAVAQATELVGADGARGLVSLRQTQSQDSGSLLGMFANTFCAARRTLKTQVEEVSWQPMRWNGKRWVKGGKRVPSAPEGVDATLPSNQSGLEGECVYAPGDNVIYRKSIKLVERSIPQPIESAADILRWAKASCKAEARRACAILRKVQRDGRWTPARRGELSLLLKVGLKIRASGRDKDELNEEGELERGDERDANWFLYEHCKLPKQYVKEKGALTDRLASDEEAVIKAWLATHKDKSKRDRRALWFATLKKLLTEARNLKAQGDPDGRIRSSFNFVGTETHRLSNSASPTGTSRLNLQTITKKHRRFYLADEGCEMCQRDLSGADGWTVAAYCAMLGDTNLLEDYKAKLKPAQIMTLVEMGHNVNAISRDALRPLCKPITEETHPAYFANKRKQHGWSYRMGDKTTSDQILTDSLKKGGLPIYIEPSTCKRQRDTIFFVRYPGIPRWHRWMEETLRTDGCLVAGDGFCRRFYGRKDDQETLRKALAHLPQYYTTRATVKALMRLWLDPENRREDGSLRIEPLHTVHDSLVTQWRAEEREWARGKMQAWFQNPQCIAGMGIVIPASGTYGASWGEQDNEL